MTFQVSSGKHNFMKFDKIEINFARSKVGELMIQDIY